MRAIKNTEWFSLPLGYEYRIFQTRKGELKIVGICKDKIPIIFEMDNGKWLRGRELTL